MVKVKILKKSEKPIGFRISGHADFSESGSDIVCAAVSILAYTAVNSTEAYSRSKKDFSFKDNGRTMEFEVKNLNQNIEVILNSFIIGIKSMTYNYGDYISLEN